MPVKVKQRPGWSEEEFPTAELVAMLRADIQRRQEYTFDFIEALTDRIEALSVERDYLRRQIVLGDNARDPEVACAFGTETTGSRFDDRYEA